MDYPTTYRTVSVDGLPIFYREAGDHDAPVILLLHGLPSSSRMYEPLLARLSDRYRLIAPDYPGFGHSTAPAPSEFVYTFDHLAEVMTRFTETLGLSRYSLFMQDYGGPVGFRMAMAHSQRLETLIVQNAVAHDSGLGTLWDARRAFWADRVRHEETLRKTSCHSRLPAGATSAATRMSSVTILISGQMSSRFSASPAKRTSRPSCSTTTATTSRLIRAGRNGCAGFILGCSCFGANTTHRSTFPNPKLTGGMCPTPRSISSMQGTSPWTPQPIGSPILFAASSDRQIVIDRSEGRPPTAGS